MFSSNLTVFANKLFLQIPSVLAQAADGNPMASLWRHLLAAMVFAIVGIAVLGACFWIMKKLTPFSVTKEIEQDQNVALAVLMGSVIIGMAMIISAAILG